MITSIKQFMEMLSIHMGSVENPFPFVRLDHGESFPEYPFGSYTVFPVQSTSSGMYSQREEVENPDPTKSEYRCSKTEQATVSISFYTSDDGINDPIESAYDLAETAINYVTLYGQDELRQAGFFVRPVSSPEDRSYIVDGVNAQIVCGLDLSVKVSKYVNLVVDRIDIDATMGDFDLILE